ncbi:hypothetical protein STEG23_033812, partial [Scotinomys teguina]
LQSGCGDKALNWNRPGTLHYVVNLNLGWIHMILSENKPPTSSSAAPFKRPP